MLWAEAVSTAVYVRNRIINVRTAKRTPFELYSGRKPDVRHLVRFGQPVHVLNHDKGISKFSAKTTEAYIVGYGPRTNSYRCFIANSKEIITTSDVFPANHSTQTDAIRNINQPLIPFMICDQLGYSSTHLDNEVITETLAPETSQLDEASSLQMNESIDLQNEPIEVARERCNIQTPIPIEERNSTNRTAESNNDTERRAREIVTHSSSVQAQAKPTRAMAPSTEANKSRHIPQRNVKSTYSRHQSASIAQVEPQCFSEAVNGDNSKLWQIAINDELNAHKKNETWEVVPMKSNYKQISPKWIFKVKYDSKGNIERYKARLVARGFSQVAGIDYNEIFAPVVRMDSVRLLFSICAQYNLMFVQFDIATAFLYGDIFEELYLAPPEGLKLETGYTCKLKKSLYGLKQAPRCWNHKFADMLRIFNMKQTTSDPCVYVRTEPDLVYLAIYVDDGLVFAKDQKTCDRLIGYLRKHFEVRTVDSSCFIGVEIRQLEDGSILLNQRGYIDRMLVKFNMTQCKPAKTPIETGHTLNKIETMDKEILKTVPYAEAVGSLMYCALRTRPDIAYTLSLLSKYTSAPRNDHWEGVKRVLRYLSATKNYGLLYKRCNDCSIVCYTDADWAADHKTRRSISGMVSFLNTGPISFKAQQQPSVALSTAESEYVAATDAVKELIWLKRFVDELCIPIEARPTLYCDNQSAIKLIRNPEFHQRTKHIDIRYHFIREKYFEGIFEPKYIETENQKADLMTKALAADKFARLRTLIGCVSIEIYE